MSGRGRSLAVWSALAVLGTVPMLSGCGSDGGDDDGDSIGDDTSAVVDVLPDGIPDDVEPDKVLLAAIILAAGDVDVALSEALVTAEEVDLAAEALENGSLGGWVFRAEAAD